MSDIFLCSPKPYQGVNSLSMIEFKHIEQEIDFKGVDTLIFTSKEAVKNLHKLTLEWKKIPSISIGNATTKIIKKLGGEILWSGDKNYGETLAEDIIKNFSHRSFLYLRPKVISFDFKNYLSTYNINCKESIIYETVCKKYETTFTPPPNSIIIFTSPSTIKCFLENFNWDSSYRAIVIGSTTLKHIPKEWQSFCALKPTIEECIKIAHNISFFK